MYLTDIAARGVFERRMEEGETSVLAGELVGMVDAVVAGGAEGSFIGGAVNSGFRFVTNVALDLHYCEVGFGELWDVIVPMIWTSIYAYKG